MQNIHERITIIVTDSKLTKTAFAKRINVSQAMVSMLCSGTASPSDRTIKDICREFNINEEWLRYGIGTMSVEPTQRDKLTRFFADVLATAPDERSAFIAALAELPTEFWPLITELAKGYVANIKKEED